MLTGIKIEKNTKGQTTKLVLDINKIKTTDKDLANYIDDFIDHIIATSRKNDKVIPLENLIKKINKKQSKTA